MVTLAGSVAGGSEQEGPERRQLKRKKRRAKRRVPGRQLAKSCRTRWRSDSRKPETGVNDQLGGRWWTIMNILYMQCNNCQHGSYTHIPMHVKVAGSSARVMPNNLMWIIHKRYAKGSNNAKAVFFSFKYDLKFERKKSYSHGDFCCIFA